MINLRIKMFSEIVQKLFFYTHKIVCKLSNAQMMRKLLNAQLMNKISKANLVQKFQNANCSVYHLADKTLTC